MLTPNQSWWYVKWCKWIKAKRNSFHLSLYNLKFNSFQSAIEQRKAAFENKSIEIESYLAEIEEKEKQWLEQDDGVKAEDSDSLDGDSPAPASGNPSRLNENDEAQREIHKVPTGENRWM